MMSPAVLRLTWRYARPPPAPLKRRGIGQVAQRVDRAGELISAISGPGASGTGKALLLGTMAIGSRKAVGAQAIIRLAP